MRRIHLITGTEPFLIIAPHGAKCNDYNTDLVASLMARELGGYAVINTGWVRDHKPSYDKNLANLNNLKHCKNNKVRREYLDPIISFKQEILKTHANCFQFLIHGMSNNVRKRVKDNVEIVVGYGQGSPPSYSCGLEYKDRLLYALNELGINAYEAQVGGRFAAWHKHNVNQLWVRYDSDLRVQSVQMELCPGLRDLEIAAHKTAELLTATVNRVSYKLDKMPEGYAPRQC